MSHKPTHIHLRVGNKWLDVNFLQRQFISQHFYVCKFQGLCKIHILCAYILKHYCVHQYIIVKMCILTLKLETGITNMSEGGGGYSFYKKHNKFFLPCLQQQIIRVLKVHKCKFHSICMYMYMQTACNRAEVVFVQVWVPCLQMYA